MERTVTLGKEINGFYVFTLTEAAVLMGSTESTIRNYIKRGQIKSVKIGASLYVLGTSIEEFTAGPVNAAYSK